MGDSAIDPPAVAYSNPEPRWDCHHIYSEEQWSVPCKVVLSEVWLLSHLEDAGMPLKKHKPEEIVATPRKVDVLVSRGKSLAEAVRSISVTQFTYYRWRKDFGGLKTNQVKRLKAFEKSRTVGALLVQAQ